MIKKFDTNFGGGSASTSSGSSSKGIITLIVVVAIGFLGYKFIVKPMLDKKNSDETK